MGKQKFKRGDSVRLIDHPDNEAIVSNCLDHMVFVYFDADRNSSYPFGEPDAVERVPRCPECLTMVDQNELDTFGGLCESCTTGL